MSRSCNVRQEIDIETWVSAGADFVVTGPFTVGSVGAHCATASTVCMPSTQSIVRTLCQLLTAYSCLEESATRSQIT